MIARRGHPCGQARSLRELLEQDWVVNYTAASYESFMRNLFWQHDAQIDPSRLHCAHSTALLLELIRYAGMISYCPRPLLLTDPMRGWVHAFALAEQFETSRLGIITRHNAVRGPAAQCFTDCLLQEIRRRARSAAQKDSELFDELDVLY